MDDEYKDKTFVPEGRGKTTKSYKYNPINLDLYQHPLLSTIRIV